MSATDASAAALPVSAEELLQQLAAVQAGQTGGLSSDALTQAILERLNEEVARVYAEASADGGDQLPGDGPVSPAKSSASRLDSSRADNRPKPVDLWKAAHEVDRAPKEKVILTQDAWEDLVSRLNESSKKKELHLLKAQHKQLADQLAGLTFTPHISEKSRELASLNKALPERVAALMRKKKTKLDKIRNEKVQKEMEEATFKPNLNKTKAPVDGMVRKIGHLMQYEIDRRLRAEQRKALIQEVEDRELTFQPHINKNSERIVSRLQQEAVAKTNGEAPMSPATTARSKKTALLNTLAGGKPLGRSYLPGHEQETFHPTINPRSRTLNRPGVDDKDVYTRLYGIGARPGTGSSKSPRSKDGSSVVDGGDDGVDAGSSSFVAGSGSVAGMYTGDGDIGPRHPEYFNTVAYDSSRDAKHDFILRRLGAGSLE